MNVDEAERWVLERLREVGLERQSDYTTGEAARVIGVSDETVRRMCVAFEPDHIPGRDPSGLMSIRLRKHYKIPHLALVDWFARNSSYRRLIDG